MARQKSFLTKTEQVRWNRLMKVANHGEDCRCRNKDCIGLRRSIRKWHKKMKPMIDAIRDSERITAADLAIVINTRA